MVKFHCGIISILILILNGQSEAHRNYHLGARVLEHKEEIELTNDCGMCAFDIYARRRFRLPGMPRSCKNGPGGNHCKRRLRRNIRAHTESESNYSKNEGETSEVAKSDVIHKSESSSSDLQRDLSGYHQDNRYVFVRLCSIGDVRPSEASIDDVVLKINDSVTNALSDQASTFDGVSWNRGVSPDWKIFSNGTTFMTKYGTLRPGGEVSSYADIYGDQEGIWTRVKIKDSEEKIEKLSLSVSLKFGRGNTDPKRYYKIEVGTGSIDTNGDNFTVLAEATVAPTDDKPGNTSWETLTASWQSSGGVRSHFSNRWEEMILDRKKCEDVVYINEKNNVDGGVTRPVTTIEFSEQYLSHNIMYLGNICGDSTVAKRETVILIACKELLETDNNDFTYFIDKTVDEDDVYVTTSIQSSSHVTSHTKMNTVCNNLYELVTSGDCMAPEIVNNANECKDAFKDTFGVDNVRVEKWNTPSYAKGCFKHNAQSTTRWVYNQNGGPGTSGHCTRDAACVCRAPEWIMTYGVGSFENEKQNSRLWKAGSKFIKCNVPPTTSPMCGIESCTKTVLDRIACKKKHGKSICRTCGNRIKRFMKKYSENKACKKVAKQQFPSVCGPCNAYAPNDNTLDPTFYIRRRCDDCAESHKDIIYKRLTRVPRGLDVEDLFLANWSSKNNIMGVDFNLYSSITEAMWNVEEWQFCNYDDGGIGFPRDCGPNESWVPNQWNSLTRGGKSSVAYYVWHKNYLIH